MVTNNFLREIFATPPRADALRPAFAPSLRKCPRQESNLHHLLRREVFYPLDYGDDAPLSVLSVGIEPTLQAPQAYVLSIERRERGENCITKKSGGLPGFSVSLLNLLEGFHEARLLSCGSIFLDEAALHCFIDSLIRLRERLLRAVSSSVFNSPFKGIFSAEIYSALTCASAESLLG